MDNLRFKENIIMTYQDDDYDDYRTSDTSTIDEASFPVPATTEPTSTLQIRQKVKLDNITASYRHLNVVGNPGLVGLDWFITKTNSKTGNNDLLFADGINQWQSLTNKCTGDFLAPNTPY